jgi:hypothetical protein
MDSILEIDTGVEKYIIFIPHLQSIKIAYAEDEPSVTFSLTSDTIKIPINDLWQVTETKNKILEKYEADCLTYKEIQEQNTKQITTVVLKLTEMYIAEDKFNYRQSKYSYRQMKPVVIKKLSSFVYNCLNFYWCNFKTDRIKHIKSISIPAISDIDRQIEKIFIIMIKDLDCFDTKSWADSGLLVNLILKCEELCQPTLQPIKSSYKLSKDESYNAAMEFVKKINEKVESYLKH